MAAATERERTDEPVDQIEHVGGQIGDHAAAGRRLQFPFQRRRRIGVAAVQVGGAERRGFRPPALLDQLFRPQRGGKEPVLKRHKADRPVARQRCGDLVRLGHGGHQRLVAIDVLAVGDGREQGILVEIVGRADVDDVDRRVLGHRAVIDGRHVGADRLPRLFGGFRPGGHHVGDSGPQRHGIEIKRQIQVAVGVNFADHAEAEDAGVERLAVAHRVTQPSSCSFRARSDIVWPAARFQAGLLDQLQKLGVGAQGQRLGIDIPERDNRRDRLVVGSQHQEIVKFAGVIRQRP